MKNPFEKKQKLVIISSLIVGSVVAGSIVYLYMTDAGEETRKSFKHKARDLAKNLVTDYISARTSISKKTLLNIADYIIK